MTADQYWNGDPEWARAFRRADEIRLERRNQELWLQGMYVYEAICDASPILHDFAKKGTRPIPYVEKPYPITEKQQARTKVEKGKATFDKGKKMMEAFMKAHNGKYEGNAHENK